MGRNHALRGYTSRRLARRAELSPTGSPGGVEPLQDPESQARSRSPGHSPEARIQLARCEGRVPAGDKDFKYYRNVGKTLHPESSSGNMMPASRTLACRHDVPRPQAAGSDAGPHEQRVNRAELHQGRSGLGATVPQRGSSSLGARGVARCMANRIRMSKRSIHQPHIGELMPKSNLVGGMSGRAINKACP